MDNQYLEVVRRVEKRLGVLGASEKSALEDLRAQIAKSPWAIDFDSVADLYNSFYWVRNFWKAAYFFSYEYTLTPTAINRLTHTQSLDATFVGGGSGADVLAFATWFNDAFPVTKLRITVIDSSQKQLDTLALFVKETADLLDKIELRVRYLHMNAEQWHPSLDSTDVLILGHFLVENPEAVHTILAKSKDAVRKGGDIVIIERPNEVMIHHARQVLANAGLTLYDVITDEKRMGLVENSLSNSGTTGVTSQYLRATQPDSKLKSELVSKYFQAWRNTAIEPIREIFGSDASFKFRAELDSVNGIDEMLEYWRSRPMLQSDVKVLIKNVTYTQNVAVCAFEGDFNTPTTHEVIKGSLCFGIDNYTRKIRQMTGHYGVIKTPL